MPHLFSFDEASSLLPRLRDIVSDLQNLKRARDRLQEQIGALTGRASGNGHLVAKDLNDKRARAESITSEMNVLFEEITSMGCELKGVEQGLIDFPHERDGRVVYLCWQLGEERIEWWHDVDAGFAGRERL
jgi:hypothetical protein